MLSSHHFGCFNVISSSSPSTRPPLARTPYPTAHWPAFLTYSAAAAIATVRRVAALIAIRSRLDEVRACVSSPPLRAVQLLRFDERQLLCCRRPFSITILRRRKHPKATYCQKLPKDSENYQHSRVNCVSSQPSFNFDLRELLLRGCYFLSPHNPHNYLDDPTL